MSTEQFLYNISMNKIYIDIYKNKISIEGNNFFMQN